MSNTTGQYEVIDRATNESHGTFDTLEEARGCVAFDGLTHYAIWCGDVIIDDTSAEMPEDLDGLGEYRRARDEARAQ